MSDLTTKDDNLEDDLGNYIESEIYSDQVSDREDEDEVVLPDKIDKENEGAVQLRMTMQVLLEKKFTEKRSKHWLWMKKMHNK